MSAVLEMQEYESDTTNKRVVHYFDELDDLRTPPESWSQSAVKQVSYWNEDAVRIVSLEPAIGWRELQKVVEASRAILELGDNWDDEDGVGYNADTWHRATELLIRQGKL